MTELEKAQARVTELKRDAQRVKELAETSSARAAGLERVRADLTAELARATAELEVLQSRGQA